MWQMGIIRSQKAFAHTVLVSFQEDDTTRVTVSGNKKNPAAGGFWG
jgi:hypothetical protein